MQFCVYLPPQVQTSENETESSGTKTTVPVVYYLAGLTCNEELAMIKSGAQRIAAERGIAIVCPDTSPRGVEIEGQDDSWDFGTGAGFYVDANTPLWQNNYNMYSYVTSELPSIIKDNFPMIQAENQSIMGHSMGGHGALTLALKNPDLYKSVSAFAPICHPTSCPWGVKAFTGYLGPDDSQNWKKYDAALLMRESGPLPSHVKLLIDQGTDDQFYRDKQLLPEAFEEACKQVGQEVTINYRDGYDHSYYFISSFIADHMTLHANALLS